MLSYILSLEIKRTIYVYFLISTHKIDINKCITMLFLSFFIFLLIHFFRTTQLHYFNSFARFLLKVKINYYLAVVFKFVEENISEINLDSENLKTIYRSYVFENIYFFF